MEHSQIILQKIQERDISAYRLAKETGISESLFSKWKKHPTSEIVSSNLTRIADYLGCSVDSLLGREEQQNKPTPIEKDGLNEDEMEHLFMSYVQKLTPDQQKMLLAQMQVMKESQKGVMLSATRK